ncbi:MAG: hypothetical protein NT164_08630 [Verrucomicrobiae bacterium]|nr:hypothetical protein [Verrucomicrobiae bacterium]
MAFAGYRKKLNREIREITRKRKIVLAAFSEFSGYFFLSSFAVELTLIVAKSLRKPSTALSGVAQEVTRRMTEPVEVFSQT